MSRIEQVLHGRTIWSSIPSQLYQNIERMYNTTSWYYSCQSRTLQNVLQTTLSGYGNGYTTSYKLLAGMCSLLMQNKLIKVIPGYKLIKSEEGETLDIVDVVDMVPENRNTQAAHIYIQHIPKGKTYLKKVLDSTRGLTRLQQIETFCIEHPNHFIRIYRGFGKTGASDITIFTDYVSKKLIHTLWVMLPNLFDIIEMDVSGSDIIPEEYALYNTKVQKLREVFELLYDYYKDNSEEDLGDVTELKANLTTLLSQFTALFNFEEAGLNSFIAKLAKARNEGIIEYHQRNLDTAISKIATLEKQLEEQYELKCATERQILGIKQISDEDVAPLMETIKSTKAIEILSTTENEMRLRITAPLQYFQSSDFERYENNLNSEYLRMYSGLDSKYTYYKKILHKVFVTREYNLLAQGIIRMSISPYSAATTPLNLSAQTTSTTDFTEFPNPHLWHHNCWSAARTEINKNICEGNFELVVMQMVAAVQTVNIAEHASFVNGLLYDFKNRNLTSHYCSIVDTKSGKKYTLEQMIEHEKELEQQEKQEENNKIIQAAKETLETNKTEGYTQVELPDDGEDWTIPNEEVPF